MLLDVIFEKFNGVFVVSNYFRWSVILLEIWTYARLVSWIVTIAISSYLLADKFK